MILPPSSQPLPKLSAQSSVTPTNERIEVLGIFADLPDCRRHANANNLAKFLQLVIDGFNHGPLAQRNLVYQIDQAIFHVL